MKKKKSSGSAEKKLQVARMIEHSNDIGVRNVGHETLESMSEDGSNNQAIDEVNPTNIPLVTEGIRLSNAMNFNVQTANLMGFQPNNVQPVFQFQPLQTGLFQQTPYSPTFQQCQSMQFQQAHLPGTFQYNNFIPPQVSQTYTHSSSSTQLTSTPVDLTTHPVSSQRFKRKCPTGGTKGRTVWTTKEDVELCVAWSKISEDPAIGTNQQRGAFWTRVKNQFNRQMKDNHAADYMERSLDGCSSRWRLIHPAVTKWTVILAEATRLMPSGWNTSNVESQARSTYQQTYHELFQYEECWKILKDFYKWQTWSVKHGESSQSAAFRPSESSRSSWADDDVHIINPIEGTSEATSETIPPLTSPPTDSVCNESNDIPQCAAPSTTSSGKSPVPPLYGPRTVKRPMGVKNAKNARQRAKQRFIEAQSEGVEKITAALLTVDKDFEERARQAREGQCQRDEVMRLYLEEENNRSKEDHEYKRASRRTNLLKDLMYVTGVLKDAYKQLDDIDHRSVMTPRERSDYETTKKTVEVLRHNLQS